MTSEDDAAAPAGTLGRVSVATAVAAASGYLVLLLAARQLGASGYAVFAVFWAAYGMVTGTQNGQLQETTRAVRSAAQSGRRSTTRPLLVNVSIGCALAAVIAATSPLWSGRIFTTDRGLSVILLAAGVASFAVYAYLSGALSGSLNWSAFAALLTVDALIRLAGAVAAVAAGGGITAFLVVTVAGSVSWCLLLMVSPSARRAVGLPVDVDAPRYTAQTLTAMAAAAASAVVVMGFPVLIRLTGQSGDDARVVGAVILAVTLTRAPLLVPLNSFQGVLIARFVATRRHLGAALVAPVGLLAVVGAVGAGLAWLIGPWLLERVFGADFRLGGGVLALFTVGATTLALLTVTGAATIATDAHRWYAVGWWVAAAVSAGLLALPMSVTARVSLSLIAGPLVGIAVHLVAMRSRMRPSPAAARDIA